MTTTLTRRVEVLEEQVASLSDLPPRVAALETAFTEFRSETRREFADLRSELAATRVELREEIRAGDEETRREMRALNEETRRHMRALHEEVISRIALLQEALPRSTPLQRRRKNGRTKGR